MLASMIKGDNMKKLCCIICRKPLNDGIMINGRGICKCCEDRLVRAQANTDFYEYYKHCIKKTVAEPMLRGEDTNCQNYHL